MMTPVLFAAALLASPQSMASSSGKFTPLPFIKLHGNDSRVPSARYGIYGTQKEFNTAWARHSGEQDPYYAENPAIVFDEKAYMAVLIFSGPGGNSMGVNVKSVDDMTDKVRIRYSEYFFQTAGPDGGGVHSNAWGLAIIPHTEKPIVFEVDENNIIGGEPKWKERVTLQLGKKTEFLVNNPMRRTTSSLFPNEYQLILEPTAQL